MSSMTICSQSISKPSVDIDSFDQLELCPPSVLDVVQRNDIFPELTLPARDNAIDFPTTSDRLRPVSAARCMIDVPRVSIFKFPEVTVHGFRLFQQGNNFFTDQSLALHERSRFARYKTKHLEDVCLSNNRISSRSCREPIDGPQDAIFCTSNEPSNYGSFLFRTLPKLLTAATIPDNEAIFLYAPSEWIKVISRQLVPNKEIIHHDTTVSHTLKNAIVPTLAAPEALLRPALHGLYTEILTRLTIQGYKTPPKIYLSRRSQSKSKPFMRVLENETELVERLSSAGFVEICPEKHTFAEQISIISNAKLIVCPGGSGLFGTYFARRAELIVDIEANDTWLHAHRNVLSSTGRPYTMVQGQTNLAAPPLHGEVHRNWTIDVETLLAGMKSLGVPMSP